jgi:hypothetical protein
MCGPYHMSFPSYQYSPREAALYNALSPVLWGVFLSWVTFADSIGHAGTNAFIPRAVGDAGRYKHAPAFLRVPGLCLEPH